MIDFELSQAQKNVRDMAHWLAETEVRPVSLQADREGGFPDSLLKKLMQLGVGGGALPGDKKGDQEVGAALDGKEGYTQRIAVIGAEELAWGDASLAINLPGPGLGGPPVKIMGTEAQKERFLGMFDPKGPPKYGAYALTEPGAGSDSKAISTTCVKDGDEWVINGVKCFITNGAKAEWNVVFATVDRSLGRQGFRAFVVERDRPGFRVGRIEKKLGLRASETAELVFEDCRVPADNLLGGEAHYASKEGFLGAMKTFDNTRPLVAAMGIGIARASLERTATGSGSGTTCRARSRGTRGSRTPWPPTCARSTRPACSPGGPPGWATTSCRTPRRRPWPRPTQAGSPPTPAPRASTSWAPMASIRTPSSRSGFATSRSTTSSRAPVRCSAW